MSWRPPLISKLWFIGLLWSMQLSLISLCKVSCTDWFLVENLAIMGRQKVLWHRMLCWLWLWWGRRCSGKCRLWCIRIVLKRYWWLAKITLIVLQRLLFCLIWINCHACLRSLYLLYLVLRIVWNSQLRVVLTTIFTHFIVRIVVLCCASLSLLICLPLTGVSLHLILRIC